jgi:TPR repeat protein
MLSWMLLEGEIIAPDYLEAKRWAESAAAQGIAAAMTRLGMIYHNALGVERDPVAAVRWWDRAAMRGDADAQAMLGAAFHLGAGVPRDPVVAMMWLLRGQKGGSALATPFVDPVRANLTPDEMAHASDMSGQPLPEPVS